MPVTLQSLQDDVLNRLNEALNSPAGALQSGTGGASTIATSDTIIGYLNEAADDLCRSCWPLFATGSASLTSVSTGELITSFSSLTGTGVGNLWAARKVYYNGLELQRQSRSVIDVAYPTLVVDASATPLFWYPAGLQGIGLAPRPSAGASLVVNGLALPAPLVETTDAVTWLDADLTRFLSMYACYYIAIKNMEDETLANRAQAWLAQYQAGQKMLGERLLKADSSTLAQFYPMMQAVLAGQAQAVGK